MTNPNYPFLIDRCSDYCIIAVNSRLDQSPWNDLNVIGEELLREIEKEKSGSFLIDLSELDYISSATLALIVRVWKMIERKNDHMVIVASHVMVREVLRLSGLSNLWKIVSDRDEGLKQLKVGGKRRSGNKGETRGGLLAFGVSFCLLAISMAGLYLMVFDPGLVDDSTLMKEIVVGGSIGSAILGLLFSTYLILVTSGWKRTITIFLEVCFLSVLVLVFLKPNVLDIGDGTEKTNARSKESNSSDENDLSQTQFAGEDSPVNHTISVWLGDV